MRIVLSIFVFSCFCFKSHGIVYKQDKAHNPGGKKVQSFHIPSGTYKKAQYAVLEKPWDYPWGICFPKGKHNFSQKHLNWTGEAVDAWNKQYHAFVQSYEYDTLVSNPLDFPFPESHLYHRVDNRSYFVSGWPDPTVKLIVWSCDKKKYNLVYPVFGPTEGDVLAYYKSKNPVEKRYMKFWGLPYHVSGDFYGQIVMSDRHKWEREHFINVMMHELGHLLGVPHLDPDETEIMASHGFGCGKGGEDTICDLTNKDFNSFLDLFSNGGQVVRNWPWFKKDFEEDQEYYKIVIGKHEREKDLDLAMLRAEWTDDTDRWVQYVRREFEKIQREKDDEDLIRAVLEADIYLDDRDRWVKSVRSKLEELRRNRYYKINRY